MPGPLFEQELLAAVQFDGTADMGLVTIADFGQLPNDPSQSIVVKSVSYDSEGPAHDVLLVFNRAGQALVVGGKRQVELATPSFGGFEPLLNRFSRNCGQNGLVIPRDQLAMYEIQFHTIGKIGRATFILHGYVEAVDNA